MADRLWAPFDHVGNPYAMYARLRKEDPVHKAQTGEYILTKYKDIKTVLKSSDFRAGNRLEWLSRGITYFKNQDEDLGEIYKAINSFLLFINAPDHLPIRNMVMKVWDDREVNEVIDSTADELLNKFSGDAVKDYAQPLPAIVVSRIMGIPVEDHAYLRDLGVKMIRSFDAYHSWKDLVELNKVSGEFVNYFRNLIGKPTDGLVAKLTAASKNILREEQLVSILIFLFISGEETSAASIGTAIRNVLLHDIKSIGDVGELFRYDPPVQFLGRITKRESAIGGVTIPADSALTLVLGSANRDEDQFDNPDTINFERSPNPHLSFGYGTHYCLGEWLGKSLTQIAVEKFARKFPAATVPEQKMEWSKNLSVRALKSLKVNV